MKEGTTFWKRELVLPWQSKLNPGRGGARRLPKTLSSMQIILICGFASIMLLSNTITSSSFSWFIHSPEIETSPHSLASFSSPKRNIAQIKEKAEEKEIAVDFTEAKVNVDVAIDDESKNIEEVKKPELPEKKSETEQKHAQNEISQQQQRKLEAQLEVKPEDMYMPTWMPPGMKPKSLGPNPTNWDEQRAAWLEKHPEMKLNSDGKPRMLLVTGSSPWPCVNPVGDHYILKFIKNKMDYCRQHNIEIFYNLAHLDREMTTFWAKLPILRALMLNHPEVEWFFWMDADAVFTDMLFEIPMDNYKDYNLVMWGYESGFYGEKSWVAINNGVFFLRNCQWSLDLFEMWAPMGPDGTARVEAGKMLTAFLSKRPEMPADDQSALGYLILTKPELQPKVKLEWTYELSGYWADHVQHYEEHMTKDHPGLGDKRWPFTTHFTGCQPCSGVPNPVYNDLNCVKHMERAFNFADNQVLQMLGFQHESLETPGVRRIKEENDHPLDDVGPNTWVTASQSYGL